VWKEFDGKVSSIQLMRSNDGGASWTHPSSVADTSDASDHPQLAIHHGQAWLSWNTKLEGYRLIALKGLP
ncbi:MAG: exo-alpha-sialidase, partial [Gallionella sp.]